MEDDITLILVTKWFGTYVENIIPKFQFGHRSTLPHLLLFNHIYVKLSNTCKKNQHVWVTYSLLITPYFSGMESSYQPTQQVLSRIWYRINVVSKQ